MSNVEPADSMTSNMLIRGLCKEGRSDEAIGVHQKLIERKNLINLFKTQFKMALNLKEKEEKVKEEEKEKEKEKESMLQQKSAKLEKMKFTNHREFMQALIAVEFDAMGLSYTDWVNNHEEMQEFIKKKKARLLEIESEKEKNSQPKNKLVLKPPEEE
ncbi:hypothetical protein NE237_000513 [Protea cynaroides]|uniref:Uncharacterized protein n=1 Tax=Protea cynaroides TaxID=273540 RepID=A0A9Q0KRL2_9MAGN|nr:hypothetical protein NE237_000513 [Protea cynaroides]